MTKPETKVAPPVKRPRPVDMYNRSTGADGELERFKAELEVVE